MKFYRVKHIPTGLYYQPVQQNCHLSLKGKIYQRTPNLKNLTKLFIEFTGMAYWSSNFSKVPHDKRYSKIIEHFNVKPSKKDYQRSEAWNGFWAEIPESDWQIEELSV